MTQCAKVAVRATCTDGGCEYPSGESRYESYKCGCVAEFWGPGHDESLVKAHGCWWHVIDLDGKLVDFS